MSFELDVLERILAEQKRTNELLEKLMKEQPKQEMKQENKGQRRQGKQ